MVHCGLNKTPRHGGTETGTECLCVISVLPCLGVECRAELLPIRKLPCAHRRPKAAGLAAKGDELCQAIFDWQSVAVGKLCRQVTDTIDPDRIVIGGGFIEGGPELTGRILKIVQDTFKKLSFKKHANEVKFEVARSGDQAGCLGAAVSAWQFANRK